MRFEVSIGSDSKWVDIVNPDAAELRALAEEFRIPPTVIEDFLDPEHLPKFERFSDSVFLVLRARDRDAPDTADSIEDLTRKVVAFQRDGVLLTAHRADLEEIRSFREKLPGPGAEDRDLSEILVGVIEATLDSFDAPLERAETTLDQFENGVFDDDIPPPSLREAHHLKRRIALSRRILWQTTNVLQKLVPPAERAEPLYQDVRETADAYLFRTEQLLDEVNQLLQIHLAASSHKTNEVMRVLTILSVFFLPLTFIVGVYGMNFVGMPELTSPIGYPATLVVMALVSLGTYVWFKRRGWL